MKYFTANEIGRVVVINLQKGDRVLPSIQLAIDELNIKSGIVVSGIGSLRAAEYHAIATLDDHPTDKFFKFDAPMEMGSIQGLVLEGTPHLHYTFSDEKQTFTGHMEPDTVVQYLAEIVLLEINDLNLVHRKNEFGVAYIADAGDGG
ncbi:MAG TPA: DNA-binding protein [Clostridia bacterium]|nr:DNA-binding protein [Clostridia bacterium]